jgi:hypothetical protein
MNRSFDYRLFNRRQSTPRIGAEHRFVTRNFAVFQNPQPHEQERFFEYLKGSPRTSSIGWHKESCHRNLAPLVAKKVKRNISHNAGAIPGQSIGTTRSPMFDPLQRLKRLPQSIMRALA